MCKKGRKLVRRGQLSRNAYYVLDALTWSYRRPGGDSCKVSITNLQRACHMARETVVKCIKALCSVGLLRKTKQRLRVLWGENRYASRQDTNVYTLIPAPVTEFDSSTVDEGKKDIRIEEGANTQAARASLASIAASRAGSLILGRSRRA